MEKEIEMVLVKHHATEETAQSQVVVVMIYSSIVSYNGINCLSFGAGSSSSSSSK